MSRLVRETYFPFREVLFEIVEDIVTVEEKVDYGIHAAGDLTFVEPDIHYHVALAPHGETLLMFSDARARALGEAMFSSHSPHELVDALRAECLDLGLAADNGSL